MVDDSMVSQFMVTEMVESLKGAVEVAQDGRSALKLLEDRSYQLLLMDCEMPVLDGYETARLIRQRESRRKAGRTPIIAITGTKDDRERCMSAGMDDFLLKPFSVDDLFACLVRWLPESFGFPPNGVEDPRCFEDEILSSPTSQADPDTTPPASSPDSCTSTEIDCLDSAHLVESTKPDEIYERIVGHYFWSSAKHLAALRRAIIVKDFESIRIAAHTLKSNSAFLGEMKLANLCQSLESLARKNSTYKASQIFLSLEAEYAKAKMTLRDK